MKRSNNRKEEFIEAASKLFETKGYNATGLNEILKLSGAPKGSLYYYFPKGKEELGAAAINLAGENIKNNLKSNLLAFNNSMEGLVRDINILADIIDNKNRTEDMTISLIALETYASSEVLRKCCEDVFCELEKIYYDFLINLGLEKEDAEVTASVLQSMMEGAITISLVKRNGDPLRNMAKKIPDIIRTN